MPMSPTGSYSQVSNFTPEQLQLFQSLIGSNQQGASSGMDWLSKLSRGDEATFNQIEAPAYNAYNRQMGQNANRFAGVGALNSSGFQNAATDQASEFAQNLASQRYGIQSSAVDRLLNHSQKLLDQSAFTNVEDMEYDWGPLIASILGKAAGGIF